jgi:hypothetical protein
MMAAENFVEVTYRGIEVGKGLKLTELGPSSAFLEFEKPLPVGAHLDMETDSGFAITGVVQRVHEQVADAEIAAGMRLRVDSLVGAAEAWWASKVTREDPQIPEPPIGLTQQPPPDSEGEEIPTAIVAGAEGNDSDSDNSDSDSDDDSDSDSDSDEIDVMQAVDNAVDGAVKPETEPDVVDELRTAIGGDAEDDSAPPTSKKNGKKRRRGKRKSKR